MSPRWDPEKPADGRLVWRESGNGSLLSTQEQSRKPTSTRSNQRSEPEIGDFDYALVDQHVLRLQIAMNDLLRVKISQPLKQLVVIAPPLLHLAEIVHADAQRRVATIQKVAQRAVRAVLHLNVQTVAAVFRFLAGNRRDFRGNHGVEAGIQG